MQIAMKEDIYFMDEQCEKKFGIPASLLMENAGRNSFLWIKENIKAKKFLIFCAHGNNGGDGAVLARYLMEGGFDVTVVLLGDVIGKSKDIAKANFIRLKENNAKIIEWDLISREDFTKIKAIINETEVIVDAIFGVGFNGELFSQFAEVVEEINDSGKLVISLDIPSGVIANGGNFKLAVRANYTLTFGFVKYGMIDYPGANFCGEIELIDIGIPEELIRQRKFLRFITEDYIKSLIKNVLTILKEKIIPSSLRGDEYKILIP